MYILLTILFIRVLSFRINNVFNLLSVENIKDKRILSIDILLILFTIVIYLFLIALNYYL